LNTLVNFLIFFKIYLLLNYYLIH